MGLSLWTKVSWQKLFLDLSLFASVFMYAPQSLVTPMSHNLSSNLLGPKVLTADIMILDKEECLQQWTCSCSLCCEIRALDT